MDVARLNFSHGTHEQHHETAQLVRSASGRAGRAVAILQDLPGPKLRIGPLKGDTVDLKHGDTLTFICGEESEGDQSRMSVTWAGLADGVEPGEVLYLADGSVRLRATAARPGPKVSWMRSSRSAASSPRARGSTSPARPTSCRRCPRRTSSTSRPGSRSASTSSR